MKIGLAMIMCSLYANICMDPHVLPNKYESMYDCMMGGYDESIKKMKELGKEEVNKHGIYIRFICIEIPEAVIIPLPKPKVDT